MRILVSAFMFKAQKDDSAFKNALAGLKAAHDVRTDLESPDVNLLNRLEKQSIARYSRLHDAFACL